MTTCPSCGFKWQSEALAREQHPCPRCGAGGLKNGGSMTIVYAAMLGLVALLTLAIGGISWGMPASKWLVGGGALLLALCAGMIWRSTRANVSA